eukprot:6676770-Pyramimonas_sp.AAC.1
MGKAGVLLDDFRWACSRWRAPPGFAARGAICFSAGRSRSFGRAPGATGRASDVAQEMPQCMAMSRIRLNPLEPGRFSSSTAAKAGDCCLLSE